ncbi:MAG: hypothetical protein MAGBODY4_00807 [Candidatus Marinimicrobia bacterium]|nr:hypothetical protein [Candidatus Neomarinimicrobiota bacterium]
MQRTLFSPDSRETEPRFQSFQPPFYIGTGGWNYKDWVGPFYPAYLDNSDWLAYYPTQFHTVEIDSTFYGIPKESTVVNWRDRTPNDFQFTAKVPRAITHERRLNNCQDILTKFVKRMAILGDKLGPLLLQFPPGFSPEYFEVLHDFLPQLPVNYRFAIEIRDPGWLNQQFYDLLAANNVALTLTDSSYIPKKSVLTADFTYIRWIGSFNSDIQYFGKTQRDRSADLREWALVLAKKFAGKNIEVYGYFNNLYAGFSPDNIQQLFLAYQQVAQPDE